MFGPSSNSSHRLLISIGALAILSTLTVNFPGLNFLSNGAPTSSSVTDVLNEADKLQYPRKISYYVEENHVNKKTDQYLQKAWENAKKCNKNAEKVKEKYSSIFTSFGINLEALSELLYHRSKAEAHYRLSMKNSRKLYEEVINDLIEENQKLDYLGADSNYTGPASQVYEKTEEVVENMDKIDEETSCKKEEDIATLTLCLTERIKNSDNGKITPKIFNTLTDRDKSLISKYSQLKKEIESAKRGMKKRLKSSRRKFTSKKKDLEENIKYLESQRTSLVTSNPGTASQVKVKSRISGSPREQLIELKEVLRREENSVQEIERIVESERENYLSRSIQEYENSFSEVKSAFKASEDLKDRLKNIQNHYKKKLKREKKQIESTLTTTYWKRLREKEKRALNQPTYGERIQSLKDVLEYSEFIKKAQESDLFPLKTRIKEFKNKIEKYEELGYSLSDKKSKLNSLSANIDEIEGSESLLNAYDIFRTIKSTVKRRVSPLEQRIIEKREKARKYLDSAVELSTTKFTEERINEAKLEQLKSKYRRTVKKEPLERPKKKIEMYKEITDGIRASVDELKSTLLNENTEIQVNTGEIPVCNQPLEGEATMNTYNPLPIPIYNVNVKKEFQGLDKEFLFHINSIRPRQEKEKSIEEEINPYRCTEIQDKVLKVNEDRETNMKEIKIERRIKRKKVLIDFDLPEKTEIIHLSPRCQKFKDKVKVEVPDKSRKIKITYEKPSDIKLEESEKIDSEGKVLHTIEVINSGEKLRNFTLRREIDALGEINSNKPIEKNGDSVKIILPVLSSYEKISLRYRLRDFRENANDKLTKIMALNSTRKKNPNIKSEVRKINDLYREGKYQQVIEESPEAINTLQRQPEEELDAFEPSISNSTIINTTSGNSNTNNESLIRLASSVLKLVNDKKLENLVQETRSMKGDEREQNIEEIDERLDELEPKVIEKMRLNESSLEKLFGKLGKAFRKTVKFEVDEENIPYTQKDLKSLKERRKDLRNKASSESLVEPTLEELIDQNSLDEIKNQIQIGKELRKDAEETLQEMEEFSLKRLKRAKKEYSNNPSESAEEYLKKAKRFHQNGEYLNSMLSSRKAVQFSSKGDGIDLPIKYIVAGVVISGTALYFFKKPKKDEEDDENPLKLKRGK